MMPTKRSRSDRQRDVAARCAQVGGRAVRSLSRRRRLGGGGVRDGVCFSDGAARLASSAFFPRRSSSARCGRLLLQLASGPAALFVAVDRGATSNFFFADSRVFEGGVP